MDIMLVNPARFIIFIQNCFIHTERAVDRETEGQRDRETERERQTDRQTERERETDRQTDRRIDRERQTDRQTDRQRDREPDRQRQILHLNYVVTHSQLILKYVFGQNLHVFRIYLNSPI